MTARVSQSFSEHECMLLAHALDGAIRVGVPGVKTVEVERLAHKVMAMRRSIAVRQRMQDAQSARETKAS